MSKSWYLYARPAEEVNLMLSLRQEGFSYAAVGREFDVSRQRVHQILSKSCSGYKEIVWQRTDGCCEICGLPEEEHFRHLTYHHKNPCLKNYNKPDNILLVCLKCHQYLHSMSEGETMNKKSERLVAQCSADLKARIDAQAHREHSSTAHFIRKVLWAYLADHEPEPENWQDEAQARG